MEENVKSLSIAKQYDRIQTPKVTCKKKEVINLSPNSDPHLVVAKCFGH